MIWGWAAAAATALFYGVASVVQAIGVRSMAAMPVGTPTVRRLWAARLYGVGLAMDGIGFLASVVALQTLPLFLVQAAVAASVGVTALTAAAVLRASLSRIQIAALVVLGAGLVALATAAPTQSSQSLSWAAGLLLAALSIPLAVVIAVAATRGRGSRWAFPALAISAGFGFAGVGIAARVLVIGHPWWSTISSPPVWALAGYGLTSTVAFALALDRGSVTVASGWALAVETTVPTLVGLTVLGDRVRPGHGVWAAIGFAAVLAGCLALAGNAHPEPSTQAP